MEPKSALKAKHLCLCYLISFLHLWRILKNSKENFEKTQKRIKKNTMLYIQGTNVCLVGKKHISQNTMTNRQQEPKFKFIRQLLLLLGKRATGSLRAVILKEKRFPTQFPARMPTQYHCTTHTHAIIMIYNQKFNDFNMFQV